MTNLINAKLATRTNEELKNDVKASMISTDSSANLIFVLALNILEDRLTAEEYNKFEDSL
jgi:hypothetical protein